MNLGLVFYHGWGLDARFWQPLAARLTAYPQFFFDAGYFGAPQTPHLPPDHRWVGIGHSMGFAHALQAPPAGGWAALVSVAGFTRFCVPAAGSTAAGLIDGTGQPRRMVERMLRAYAREPRAVLGDFLVRCGLEALMPPPGAVLDAARLAADLALLLDMDVGSLWRDRALNLPVLALAARDDAIVSSALTESTFAQCSNTQLVWCAQGGHALGYAQADVCAASIADFLEAL